MTDFRFLVGEWRGDGFVRDARVTSRLTGSLRDDGAVVLVHVTSHEGAEDHRERIVLRTHRGRTTAVVRPDNGAEQKFHAAPTEEGARFARVDAEAGLMAWEIVPDGADAFTERFVMGEGAAAETVVRLRHERVKA